MVANRLCLLEGYFWRSRLVVIARRDVSCWVISLGGLAWWVRNDCGVNEFYFLGVRGCGFTCAFGLLSGAVLSWHPLFCRIVLLIHPCRRRIVVVASSLRGASELRLVILGRLILVKVRFFLMIGLLVCCKWASASWGSERVVLEVACWF